MTASARQRSPEPAHRVSRKSVSHAVLSRRSVAFAKARCRPQSCDRDLQTLAVASGPARSRGAGWGRRPQRPRLPVRARARHRIVPRRFTLENRRLPLAPRSFGKIRSSRFRCTHSHPHLRAPQYKTFPHLCRTCGRSHFPVEHRGKLEANCGRERSEACQTLCHPERSSRRIPTLNRVESAKFLSAEESLRRMACVCRGVARLLPSSWDFIKKSRDRVGLHIVVFLRNHSAAFQLPPKEIQRRLHPSQRIPRKACVRLRCRSVLAAGFTSPRFCQRWVF
jgi:hypothetical protein